MSTDFDVAIAGLGIAGAATARALAGRGLRVLGLDRHERAHAPGSSHGRSRIIREAYYEHPLYVPLVQRAYSLWADLERESGRQLVRVTGGLTIGPPDGTLVSGALESIRRHGLPHEIPDAEGVARRFPALAPPPGTLAVFEPRAGVLQAADCLDACLSGAETHGAELRFGEPLLSWADDGDGVRLRTPARDITAGRLILAAGGWLGGLPGLALAFPLTVERQAVHYFAQRDDAAEHPAPVLLWEYEPDRVFYSLPEPTGSIKAAVHHEGEVSAHPDEVRRTVRPDETLRVARLLRTIAPGLAATPAGSEVCIYTNTPDRHFLIDALPGSPRVWLLSACSGHGFKFAPALAEAIADIAAGGRSRLDLSPFRLARFGSS